ncbi:hypothetical protein O181_006026 [Austropuccinia psidii MF-1]|uniref:Uncharacterized protein n=1 Tax=Austropuccinia psidii MF-1 TaxID=1389203 RepID=A0A9Q3BK12_9BASI|nr:hypothetical protein [Austropuccinia psidii MF-1]
MQHKFAGINITWDREQRFHQCTCHVLNLVTKDFLLYMGQLTNEDYDFFDDYLAVTKNSIEDSDNNVGLKYNQAWECSTLAQNKQSGQVTGDQRSSSDNLSEPETFDLLKHLKQPPIKTMYDVLHLQDDAVTSYLQNTHPMTKGEHILDYWKSSAPDKVSIKPQRNDIQTGREDGARSKVDPGVRIEKDITIPEPSTKAIRMLISQSLGLSERYPVVTSPLVQPSTFDDEEWQGLRPERNLTNKSKSRTIQLKNKLGQVATWVWITVLGQLLVLAVALLFFILIHSSRTPMNQTLAERATQSPRGLALVTTAIGTLFSVLSTFLFSKSLVLYLTSHSSRPISLLNFLTVSSLSRGAFTLFRNHLGWSLLSIMTLILLNSLTASFTGIFTPTPLIVSVPISGTEFNLNSNSFANAMRDEHVTTSFPRLTPAQLSSNNLVSALMEPLALNSAYTSASRLLGYPLPLSCLGAIMNSTTGGILPAIPFEEVTVPVTPGLAHMYSFKNLKPHFEFDKRGFKVSKIFPFNYTTIQQGFTADIKCFILPNDSYPSEPSLEAQFQKNVTLPDEVVTGVWKYYVRCPNQHTTNRTFLLRPRGSTIISETCPGIDILGNPIPGGQLLILGGFGPMYSFIVPRACQFHPYFTTVQVEYSSTVNISRVLSREPVTTMTSTIADSVYGSIPAAMRQYAVDVRNKVGDDIMSLYTITTDLTSQDDVLLNSILESYFKGIIETRATLLKTPPISVWDKRLIADSFSSASPAWTRAFNGTWSYETLGWHRCHSFQVSIIGILPILIITLSSIGFSLFSWVLLRRNAYHTEEPFDPNNLVALLRAGQDGSVAESLGKCAPSDCNIISNKVKIQLQRLSAQWQLRPAT